MNFLSWDKNHIERPWKQFLVPPEESAHPPLRPVSLNGISKFFAGNDGHSRKSELVGEVNKDKIFSSVTFALFIKMQKIFFLSYSFLWCEVFIHQAASLFLPLRLRFLMICWPPFLLIRTRKPWFFFRFLLFGWNVLFIFRSVFLVWKQYVNKPVLICQAKKDEWTAFISWLFENYCL